MRWGKDMDSESALEKFYPEYITKEEKSYKVWRYLGNKVKVISNIYENSELLGGGV